MEVSISQLGGRRVVSVSDDGVGFDETTATSGHGVANMGFAPKPSTASCAWGSAPGRGTAIEVVLRAA